MWIFRWFWPKTLDQILAPIEKHAEELRAFVVRSDAEAERNAQVILDLQMRNADIRREMIRARNVANLIDNLT